MEKIAIVGLGEILWDLLPGGRQLGGAPFNFTFHCQQLGYRSAMISRIGDDALGLDILQQLADRGLTDRFIQRDRAHPTGTVAVEVDSSGQPTFTIAPDVAFDYLAWEADFDLLLGHSQAVCFGTLVQRNPIARKTLLRAINAAHEAIIVFDVNLRQAFFTREIIETSLRACRWVKLNDSELGVLKDLLALKGGNPLACLADLRKRYRIEVACLTRGAKGCLVQTDEEQIAVPGLPIQVVDTVGAGDAFTAGLLVRALEGDTLADAAVFANRLAASVAASAGGTPVLPGLPGKRGG